MAHSFKILTFNTWMLRTPLGLDIAEDVDARLRVMPDKVAATGADIVCFQENWDPGVRAVFRREMGKRGYAHEVSRCEPPDSPRAIGAGAVLAGLAPMLGARSARRDFLRQSALLAATIGLNAAGAGALVFDGVRRSMGNGLQIFSRFPLRAPRVMRFSDITRADETAVTKGAIAARAALPGFGEIDIVTTHLGAVTFDSERDREDPAQCVSRLRQARELAAWLRATSLAIPTIVAGDFNFHYREHRGRGLVTDYRLFTEKLGLRDTYRDLNGWDDPREWTDASRNPYKRRGHFSASPDGVIDYVFASPHPMLRAIESRVVLDEPISDHYAVLTAFQTRYQ